MKNAYGRKFLDTVLPLGIIALGMLWIATCLSCGTTNSFSGIVDIGEGVEPKSDCRLHVMAFIDSKVNDLGLPDLDAKPYLDVVAQSPEFPFHVENEINNHGLNKVFTIIAWLDENPVTCEDGNCSDERPEHGDWYGYQRGVEPDSYHYEINVIVKETVP